jgi:hypothetical protein
MVYKIGGLCFAALGAVLGVVGLLHGGQAVLSLGFGAGTFLLLGGVCYLTGREPVGDLSGSGSRMARRAGAQDHDGDVV